MAKSELALAPKLYQEEVLNYLYDSKFNPMFPWVVELDPTTACNLACPDCISGTLLGQGGFASERLIGIATELIQARVKAVVLIGGGEPLMHPAIENVIQILGEAGVHIGITTNGLFLTKYKETISKYVSWTRISVDAGTDDLYKIVRPDHQGRSRLKEVFENIKDLVSTKPRLTKVGLSYCFLPLKNPYKGFTTNCTEIYEAALAAKQYGCDYFELKPSFDQNHYHIIHPVADVDEATRQFNRAKQVLEDDAFAVYGATNLPDILNKAGNTQPKEYSNCEMLNIRTLITPHGVYPCPYFRGDSSRSYGDLTIQSFESLWSSQQKLSVVDNLNPCDDCRFHCIRHSSNLQIQKMASQPRQEIDEVENFNRFI